MTSVIIGLAGHVDHGKTSLIKAISGFDGDETKEEKNRGLTIDLSFSFIENDSKRVFFVDVPGHEKFVKNYLAGVFGFDSLLLIVAANDGIREQTYEHLQIAKLAGIIDVNVVITKVDLADTQTIQKLKTDIATLLKSNGFLLGDIFSFSIKIDGSGEKIKDKLLSSKIEKRSKEPLFRYYIDRSFSVEGFGTVVTGSALGGKVSKKDKVYIPNIKKDAIVKNIESAKQSADTANPSERIALNIAGIKSSELRRGYLIVATNYLRGFKEIDVKITSLNDTGIKHLSTLSMHIGSAKHDVKVKILEENKEFSFATLESKNDIFSLFSERFILRSETGTIGGGVVLNPIAEPMKKKQKIEFLTLLADNLMIKAFEMLVGVHKKGFGLIGAYQRFGLEQEKALEMASKMENVFVDIGEKVVYPTATAELLKEEILKIFKKNKRALLSKNSMNNRFSWASVAVCDFALKKLESDGLLIFENGLYKSKDCDIKDMKAFIEEAIYKELETGGFSPVAPYNIYDALDIDRKTGDEGLKKLCSSSKAIRLSHNLFLTSQNLSDVMVLLRKIISEKGFVDIETAKKETGLSRKYLIGYLEYLDKFSDIKKDGQRRFI